MLEDFGDDGIARPQLGVKTCDIQLKLVRGFYLNVCFIVRCRRIQDLPALQGKYNEVNKKGWIVFNRKCKC